MAGTFGFFSDSGLTLPIQAGALKRIAFNSDGSSGDVDYQVWFGSPDSARVAKDSTAPGTGQIVVSVADSAPSSGQPATLLKLALTQGGLAAGGQSLNLGTLVQGGAGNAVPVWLRANANNGNANPGTYLDLSLVTSYILEY